MYSFNIFYKMTIIEIWDPFNNMFFYQYFSNIVFFYRTDD